MRTDAHHETTAQPPRERDDLGDVTGYEDGDAFVVCEKSNPTAWIRSDATATLRR